MRIKILIAGVLCAIVISAFAVLMYPAVTRFYSEPNPGSGLEETARHSVSDDEHGDSSEDWNDFDEHTRSTDLKRDIALMWQTTPLGNPDRTHGPDPHASTDRAINAASRVFNTVELAGKSREDVIDLLGDPKTASNSTYNLPFWPPPENGLVYRFDCGSYGWQFNVILDEENKVKDVERMWIH